MFCPNCSAEYAQKINYCKRCGANMVAPSNTVEVHLPRIRFAGMFWAIAMMSIVGLIACFTAFSEFASDGLRGDHLLVPFVMGLLFIGGIAGGLIWQLSRLVSTLQQNIQQSKVAPPALSQYPATAPPLASSLLRQPAEPVASISEHTTRSFDAPIYIEAEKRRKRE